MDDLIDILKEAISIEIFGREYYSIFSDLVDDENAKSIFKGLARDEGEHRDLLEKEFRKISNRALETGMINEENREKARSIFPESLEALNIKETKDILKLGIRTEERSIDLYSKSADKTKNRSTRDLFLKLSDFEREHRKTLVDALFYLEQEGSWYGYSPPTIEG